jgi:hypothetical protein
MQSETEGRGCRTPPRSDKWRDQAPEAVAHDAAKAVARDATSPHNGSSWHYRVIAPFYHLDRLKRVRAVLVFSLLHAVTLGGGGFWLFRLKARAGQDLAALQRALVERDQLARLNPAPSEANERAIAAELGAAQRAVEGWRVVLRGRDPSLLAPAPAAQPIDAYFELADLRERLRARAGRLQVALRPDEGFGFATYAREGPAVAQLPAVHRQRLVVQYLVETLLEARPREVRSVQRERPNPPPAGTENGSGTEGPAEAAADFFIPDERRPRSAAGLVETGFFRLEFIGQTSVLRSFLNALAAFRLPVVVRRVEVEPVNAAPTEPGASGPAPLGAAAPSRFTVVVEFIEALPPVPLSLP